ncbi:MAG: Asp-tRNA(Asn)/Glu-tRNA(Gln) amidotransferase subunit GatB [Planctomycetota bacterium]
MAMTPDERRSAEIVRATPKIGMEVHVELATRTKMFSAVPSPAALGSAGGGEAEPNTLIDPVTLALPGALPVPNARAVELSVRVGLALECEIATRTVWDRKSYFYPDLPKGYQTSQLDRPVCGAGLVTVPATRETEAFDVRITRAHLEEDAGKLSHELPGGVKADFSVADYNRAGTPLLEIVTEPDFVSAEQCVAFSRWLRDVCRALRATEGVMQRGHIRFEPNINATLELSTGERVVTPIVEVKNLNSFRAVAGAIAYELERQPERWREDGAVMGAGAKSTRGWDDERGRTFLQRSKEDAHDYRYFPCPDLMPVDLDPAWVDRVRREQPELPADRAARYRDALGLGWKEAQALVDDPDASDFADACIAHAGDDARARTAAANLVLQTGFRIANESGVPVGSLGVDPERVGVIARMRADGTISAQGADTLFDALRESDESPGDAAERLGLVTVSDDGALGAWVDAVLEDPANARSVADVRAGKLAAVGRLIGGVMQQSGGQADAKRVRELILEKLG